MNITEIPEKVIDHFSRPSISSDYLITTDFTESELDMIANLPLAQRAFIESTVWDRRDKLYNPK